MADVHADRQILRLAASAARFGGWHLDLRTSIMEWSPELDELMGYSGTATQDAITRFPDAEQADIRTLISHYDAQPFDRRIRMFDARGNVRDMRIAGEPVTDARGEVVGIQGALVDITELVTSEQEHHSAVERLGATFDTMSDGIMLLDHDWVITYVNPRGEEIARQPPGSLVNQNIWDVAPATINSKHGMTYRRAIAENRTVSARDYVERLDIWIEATAYPVGDGLAVYFRDVTNDERAIARLRESEQRVTAQAALLDVTREAITVCGVDGLVEYWNSAAETVFGLSSDRAVGQSLCELLLPEEDVFRAALDTVVADGAWSGQFELLRPDGQRIIVESSWTLLPKYLGEEPSILAVATDVTDRRRRERQYLRAERLESIGTLASGIAHDLNNVLAPMLMSVQLLAASESDESRLRLLASLEKSVKRGADMVRQVTAFAKGVEGRRDPVDVAWLLEEMRSYARDVLPASISLTIDAEENLWGTVGDSTQLLQVLTNLLSNARDAMPDGGTVTFRARNVDLRESRWSASHIAQPGRYIGIEVEDTGVGISDEVMSRLFEPFFTTKSDRGGTGLGLATSMGIVRSHGGHLQVYSEPGNGSRFDVHLPAVVAEDREGRAIGESDAAASPSPRGTGELVLVVDDEEAIRAIVQETLEASGYTVIVAANGSEAIDVLEASATAVDLIVTDIRMPVMDGAAAAKWVYDHYPAIPIIASSGLASNERVARSASPGVRRFLAKPFTADELLVAIDAVLDDRRGGVA